MGAGVLVPMILSRHDSADYLNLCSFVVILPFTFPLAPISGYQRLKIPALP
jgi:hypothetical protein